MFNFFKKEMKAPQAPPQMAKNADFAPFQQTKVEDDLASFEVPDFTEDDLNFDLGLGEFMPKGNNEPQLPFPQGLPTEVSEVPPMPKKDESLVQPDALSIEPKTEEKSNQYNEFISEEEKEIVPENQNLQQTTKSVEEHVEEHNNLAWGEDIQADSPDDDLPKFNTSSTMSFSELKEITEEKPKTQITKKTSKQKKEAILEKEAVQEPSQGLFLPKSTYTKMIILTDDTTKKAASAEAIKSGFLSISEAQDSNVDELTKTMKSIRDSLMLTDAKLFGKGDA